MVKAFIEKIRESEDVDISNNKKAILKLRNACKDAKEVLSNTFKADVSADSLFDGIDYCE